MDKKTVSQPLYKGRSMTACMAEAFRLLHANWWRMIKASWMPLAVFTIGDAVLAVSASLPAASLWGVVAGLLVMLVGGVVFSGLFYHWVSNYKSTGEFSPLSFKTNVRASLGQALRFLIVHIPAAVLLLVLCYIGVYGCLSAFIPTPYAIPLWVGILALLVVVYLNVPLTVFCLDYLVGHSSYYHSFIKGMALGTRRWGAFFALGFMVMVVYLLFSALIGLPLEVSFIIEVMNHVSMEEGNPYAIPAFFPVVKFLLTAVVAFVSGFAFLYPILSLVFLYTSYEARSKEREAYESRQKDEENYEKM